VFLLVQYTDGNVVATTYNMASDSLVNGAGTALTKTTKSAVTADTQGYYVGEKKTVNGVDDSEQAALADKKTATGDTNMCPVNFQP
jgi:hypothetical protein